MRNPSQHQLRSMPVAEGAVRLKDAGYSPSRLDRSIENATSALLAQQNRDGHWIFQLEADTTISSEYILLRHYLGEPESALEAKLAAYLRRLQGAHGGWPLYHGGPLNISASVKAYFALKLVG